MHLLRETALSVCLVAALVAATGSAGCAAGSRTHPAQLRSSGPTVESLDPQLSSALLRAAIHRSPATLVSVANRYYQIGVRDKAMDYYSDAIAEDSAYANALEGRARVWRDWGSLSDALTDAHRAVYHSPHSPTARNTLGTVFQAMGRLDEADRAFARAAELAPHTAYPLSNRCYLSLLRGRTAEATRHCAEAIAREEASPSAGNNLAMTYALLGETEAALSYFRRSANDAVAHYNVGMMLLANGKYAEAASAFQTATTFDASFLPARRRAHQARTLMGDTSHAHD